MAVELTERKTIRFTPDDMIYLEAKAAEAGVSFGRYVREVALGDRGQGEAVAGMIDRVERLDKIRGELGRIGNNMNQIAIRANTNQPISEAYLKDSLRKVLETLTAIEDELV